METKELLSTLTTEIETFKGSQESKMATYEKDLNKIGHDLDEITKKVNRPHAPDNGDFFGDVITRQLEITD